MRRKGIDSEHRNEYQHQYYIKNRDKYIERSRIWHQENKDKIKKRQANYYIKNKEKLLGASKKTYHAKPFVLRWAERTIYKHRNDGCEVLITIPELVAIALNQPKCQLCGVDLIFWNENRGKGQRYWNSVSLDRKNNEKIITKDNILIVCQGCNMAKGVKTMDELYQWCKMIIGRVEGGKIAL